MGKQVLCPCGRSVSVPPQGAVAATGQCFHSDNNFLLLTLNKVARQSVRQEYAKACFRGIICQQQRFYRACNAFATGWIGRPPCDASVHRMANIAAAVRRVPVCRSCYLEPVKRANATPTLWHAQHRSPPRLEVNTDSFVAHPAYGRRLTAGAGRPRFAVGRIVD